MTSVNTVPQYSTLAAKAAEAVSTKWKGTTANGGRTKNYIGGKFVESKAEKWLKVHDPVCTSCPLLTDRAVHSSSVVDADGGQLRARDDRGRVQ